VEPAGRVLMAGNLVHALPKLRIWIGGETGPNAVVGRLEGLSAILGEIMSARRDAHMQTAAIAKNGVHAKTAITGIPLACMLMVADAGNHLPGIAAVITAEKRGRLDPAQQIFLVFPRFERPDIGQRSTVFLREGGGGFRFLEFCTQIGRTKDFHAEESV